MFGFTRNWGASFSELFNFGYIKEVFSVIWERLSSFFMFYTGLFGAYYLLSISYNLGGQFRALFPAHTQFTTDVQATWMLFGFISFLYVPYLFSRFSNQVLNARFVVRLFLMFFATLITSGVLGGILGGICSPIFLAFGLNSIVTKIFFAFTGFASVVIWIVAMGAGVHWFETGDSVRRSLSVGLRLSLQNLPFILFFYIYLIPFAIFQFGVLGVQHGYLSLPISLETLSALGAYFGGFAGIFQMSMFLYVYQTKKSNYL